VPATRPYDRPDGGKRACAIKRQRACQFALYSPESIANAGGFTCGADGARLISRVRIAALNKRGF
jgi:hypothetical protein